MLNRVELIGRLGKDPETRYTQGGVCITSFSVATSESWKDKQTGEKKERTEWHNVTAFNRLAEICGEYLRKGSLVFLAGKLQTDKYEKDGITRYATKVIASELRMLGGRDDAKPRAEEPQRTLPDDDFDDDIPFAWLLPLPFAPVLLEVANAAQAVL